ncbi:MAG: hypothetical protein JO345_05330 [Streptosporangiaceae bacterium]|nr:hypothetical protein [Streptosporangiaceae bacterium]
MYAHAQDLSRALGPRASATAAAAVPWVFKDLLAGRTSQAWPRIPTLLVAV